MRDPGEPPSYDRHARALPAEVQRRAASKHGKTNGQARTWTTPGDHLLRMRSAGVRYPTGLVTLDRAIRGGIPAGKRILAIGAPGAVKTTLACQLAYDLESQGAGVVFLAADEAPETIAVRLGQMCRYSRDDLEGDDDLSRRAAAEELAKRRILLLDGDEYSLEQAVEALADIARDRQGVLALDSIQTTRCDAVDPNQQRRDQVVAIMGALKTVARTGAIVIAISEMARGGYARGDRALDTSVLAAGKESGALEYGADLLLGLRSVRDEVGRIDVEIAKNRLGNDKPEFRLRLDFLTARLTEVALPDPETAAASKAAVNLARTKDKVLKAIMANELRTATTVFGLTKGTKQVVFDAIRELEAAGRLVKRDGIYRVIPPEAPRD